ncbi:hypothetical protein P9D34_11435 [Bacillus swezeyi]|uniref:hypothetical protein n=1 Tax=Bacillus swezeyi TaxID=1925020 RepID=UPI001EFB5F6A|nr:hypothetical protein [Bacillus swezeyi]MEC1261054.1 hypothetical protein [Bacillus swezeyi]MED1741118.1 hypothetical protein [Bacillus swezeyi]MED2928991.1 hypothetical protein [Bacillus swezeyi]MED2944306.1 hypothetical protein [Bacillus swezeyi]MED2964513.1 hypothetical protein [Bacillus swezeyi]
MKIRKIKISDGENVLKLCQRLDQESEFMMYEPGERQIEQVVSQLVSDLCM